MSEYDSGTDRGAGERPERSAPETIKAIPLRRPGRWIAAVVLVVALGLFLYGAATNDAYSWANYRKYLFDRFILSGVWNTVQLTVWAMVIGIALGVVIAVMRLSPNPVLKAIAWFYLWIFRGTPVYVQLVFWGLFASIYKVIDLGIPFTHQFAHINIQQLEAAFYFAIIGLGLNEAGYMAEIVRAGILSVGEGQTEAATALGMSWTQTMRRVVLPQAMRVIIPPTGNETISMLKTTSLVIAVPYTLDIYSQSRQISGRIFDPVPLLMVASTWYLAITSVMMVGQFYVERHFAKGATRKMTRQQMEALAGALGGTGHESGGAR